MVFDVPLLRVCRQTKHMHAGAPCWNFWRMFAAEILLWGNSQRNKVLHNNFQGWNCCFPMTLLANYNDVLKRGIPTLFSILGTFKTFLRILLGMLLQSSAFFMAEAQLTFSDHLHWGEGCSLIVFVTASPKQIWYATVFLCDSMVLQWVLWLMLDKIE